MGSIKYTALVAEIKGRVGGTVFQGGKTGTIIKSWRHQSFARILGTIFGMALASISWAGSEAEASALVLGRLFPDGSSNVNPLIRTSKEVLSLISASWSQLSAVQQLAWNDNAVNFPATNRFGDVYTPSGFQVYVMLNTRVVNLNQPLINYPPAPDSPLQNNFSFEVDATTGDMNVTFPDGIDAGTLVVIKSGPAMRTGKFSHMKNQKVVAVLEPCAPGTVFNIRYTWQAFFGLLNEGTKIAISVHTIKAPFGTISEDMTKAELIDAIASGAKLTKADAGIIHMNSTPANYDLYSELVSGYNIGEEGVTVLISGPDAASFGVSLTPANVLTQNVNLPADGNENLLPTTLYVHAMNIGVGVYNATLTFKDTDGNTVGVTNVDLTVVP